MNDSKSNRVVFVGEFPDVDMEGGSAMVWFAFVEESVMVSTAAVDSALLPVAALSSLVVGSEALEVEVIVCYKLYPCSFLKSLH